MSHMDPTILKDTEQFKQFCVGRGCNKKGVRQLVIKFVHKTGWFCDTCAADLVRLGLVDEDGYR
jgi:hypothetical protein